MAKIKTVAVVLVSIAPAYQVSAWRNRDTVSARAKRGSWEKFDRAMAKIRNVPPLPGDEKQAAPYMATRQIVI